MHIIWMLLVGLVVGTIARVVMPGRAGGIVMTAIGSSDDAANAVAIQADGKIVAAGYSDNGPQNVFALTRYKSDGSLDTSFGTGGFISENPNVGDNDYLNGIAVDNTSIYLCGGTNTSVPIRDAIRENTMVNANGA